MWGIPTALALLVIAAEFFGPLALVFGLFSRFAAASIALVMVGAVYMAHWPNGFFMNWGGMQAGEGFEYHILAVGLAATIFVLGSGKLSVDVVLPKSRTG